MADDTLLKKEEMSDEGFRKLPFKTRFFRFLKYEFKKF